jgi:predicted ATPase/GAF domain-containing protein/anti-anti-sigma regulatory factor
MRTLDLPGVARVHSLEENGGRAALIMEDTGARSLNHLLGAGPMDPRAALSTGVSLARTLGEIHKRRVIHKDIKPHNVLVHATEAMNVVLIDFGIAALLPRETLRARSPDSLEGTLAYMSPEQTGRMNRFVDYRTDLYSLGATLYELFTGAPPFHSGDALEVIHSHIARAPVLPEARAPGLPAAISDIVMKLLAKGAEDRYQSAYGLEHDLSECLSQLTSRGAVEPFPLGQRDVAFELNLPQKLYGRGEETRALEAAFERVSRGAKELVLIAGHPGVGKSTLVNELPRINAQGQRPSLLASGKFEQLSRGSPYVAIARASQGLIQQTLTEPAEILARRKDALAQALGPNAQVLIELVPEAELLLGGQPPAAELGPIEAQNRFALVFQSFVGVFASAERPLCLFLDDLQWADPASLRLLERLVADPTGGHLLVLGAYRDTDVDAAHPLFLSVRAIREAGARVQTLELRPLTASHVADFVADALRCDKERSAPLAEIIGQRTRGNPFFMGQLMKTLHESGALSVDPRAGSFTWDMARVRASAVTDDVVDLMVTRVERLAPGARRALERAACVGDTFELKALARILGKSSAATADDLWEALTEGLILPLDNEYRYLHDPGGGADFDVTYRFLHDRIQQAVYSLINEEDRRAVHLTIARSLLSLQESERRDPEDDDLFDFLRHLNLAAPLLTEPRDRRDLARWNLSAGRKAKAKAAYQAAAGYLRVGMAALVGELCWEEDYDLTFALHLERAECEHLAGASREAEPLFSAVLSRARTALERALILKLRVVLHFTTGRFGDAMDAGIAALELVGIEVPRGQDALSAALGAGLAEVRANIEGRAIVDLISAPPLVDPEKRLASELLTTMMLAGPLVGPILYAYLTTTLTNLYLKHGHSSATAYGYMSYGAMTALVFDRYDEARAFGELALALDAQQKNERLACQLNEMFGIFSHFFRPIRDSLAYLEKAYRAGLEAGDFLYLSFSRYHDLTIRFCLGEELQALGGAVDEGLLLMARTRVAVTTDGLVLIKQAIASLIEGGRGRGALGGEGEGEDAFIAARGGPDHEYIACIYYLLKAELALLFGDYEAALSMATLAEEKSASGKNLYVLTDLSFFMCLIVLALGGAGAGREDLGAALARHREKVATWAEACPESFLHKHLLILAEEARVAGEGMEIVLDRFDHAIAAARQGGFTHHAALASERGAAYLLERGRPKLARLYMTEAHQGYLRWGATAKAARIIERYPDLLLPTEPSLTSVTTTTITATSAGSLSTALFDVMAVVRTMAAVMSEIVLEKLLEKLMAIVLENAGAQRAILLLPRDGALSVEAMIAVDTGDALVGSRVPAEASSELAMTVVRYASRTRELVVLGAVTPQRFASDPYLATRRPKSVLGLPMVHQGRLTGVLYLENNALYDAFTPARLELLRLLASQAAIAIENALLYARVQGMSETLARQVALQTEELRDANERLTRELGERERAEREQAELKEQIIAAQKARLAEMSTPLIPITDRVMVMPLIGVMDAERAQLVLATALKGAQANQAEVVIIDITGVHMVDAGVAGTLVGAAGALRMLGTRVVITGVRPDVAQTLVGLDIDLGAIVTKGTLQSGIAYALARRLR